jgi:hypothetical protein
VQRERSSVLVDISSLPICKHLFCDSLALAAPNNPNNPTQPTLTTPLLTQPSMSIRHSPLLPLSAAAAVVLASPAVAVAHAHSGCSHRVHSVRITSMQHSLTALEESEDTIVRRSSLPVQCSSAPGPSALRTRLHCLPPATDAIHR